MSAVLGVVGTALLMLAFPHLNQPALRLMQVLVLTVSVSILLLAVLRRRPLRLAAGNALFLASLVPTVALVWLVDDGRAAEGLRWVPFEPTKLSALTLALLAPPSLWVGAVAILMFVGSGLAHNVVLSGAIRARMASAEPWALISYGVFALVLLGFRSRGRTLQAALEREHADRLALERVADVALALRDLANTPAQTMELIRHELSTHDARTAVLARHMRNALGQLARLSDLLSRYAQAVSWNKRGLSFDGATQAASLLDHRQARPHERARD
jgi:hypothetical protein